MLIAWAKHAGLDFAREALHRCGNLGWPNDYCSWLMACIAFESGETFSADVPNQAGSGAVGLIQFMPTTAQGLRTTTGVLAGMSAIDQLDYVEKYFRPYASRVRSLADMYMAILLPKYVGQPDDSVLFAGGRAYRQNAGLDANSDGEITKAEAVERVREKLAKGWLPENMGDI